MSTTRPLPRGRCVRRQANSRLPAMGVSRTETHTRPNRKGPHLCGPSGGASGNRTRCEDHLTCGNAELQYPERPGTTRNDLRIREKVLTARGCRAPCFSAQMSVDVSQPRQTMGLRDSGVPAPTTLGNRTVPFRDPDGISSTASHRSPRMRSRNQPTCPRQDVGPEGSASSRTIWRRAVAAWIATDCL